MKTILGIIGFVTICVGVYNVAKFIYNKIFGGRDE